MTQLTPPNPLLRKVAMLVCDLMGMTEKTVLIGRQNWVQGDFVTDYIAIDQLGGGERAASNESFDGVNEVMSYNDSFNSEITIEFYGNGAYDKANRLTGLLRSQAAFELKRTLGIDVLQPSRVADIKQLTGQQYGNRLQMSVIVNDNRTVNVETLRIDTAQYKFLTEEKEIII